MLRRIFATILVALSIAIIGTAAVDARGRRNGHFAHHRHASLNRTLLRLDLTDEQRAEIDAKIEELSDADATKAEIRTAVVEILEGLGVEVPASLKGRLARQLPKLDLTDEQQAAVDAKIDELEAAGAPKAETRDAVVQLLEELGVEIPTYLRGKIDRLLSRLALTEDQLAEIDTLVTQLREDGVTQSEIREAVLQKLDELGVDVPDELLVKHRRGRRARFGFFLFPLTEDQRLEILATVAELQVAAADRQAIRDAVKVLLVEWGIIEGVADGEVVKEASAEDVPAAPSTVADLVLIDAQIQAAPKPSSVITDRTTTWGAIKAGR